MSGSGDERRDGKTVAIDDDSMAVPKQGRDNEARHDARGTGHHTCKTQAHGIAR